MSTVAALDCGTNTLRLLIVDDDCVEHARELRYVGLGQDVDATGRFRDDAMARGWAAIDDYLPIIAAAGVTTARFVATSAARDAANRDDFFAGVEARLGIPAELISGTEEAQLSFAGALSGLAADAPGPVLVMDSGGGSTEFVIGDRDGTITSAISLDIGSRRLRERILHGDPPTAAEVGSARGEISRLLDTVPGLADVQTFVGVAGTVTTMAALLLGLEQYDRAAVHGSTHAVDDVVALSDRLLGMRVAEVVGLGPVSPERAQVLCGGALIVAEACQRVGQPLIASEADILDGIAAAMLAGRSGHPLAAR